MCAHEGDLNNQHTSIFEFGRLGVETEQLGHSRRNGPHRTQRNPSSMPAHKPSIVDLKLWVLCKLIGISLA